MGEFIAVPGFRDRANHRRPSPAGIDGACSGLAGELGVAMPVIAINKTPIAARGSVALIRFIVGSDNPCVNCLCGKKPEELPHGRYLPRPSRSMLYAASRGSALWADPDSI